MHVHLICPHTMLKFSLFVTAIIVRLSLGNKKLLAYLLTYKRWCWFWVEPHVRPLQSSTFVFLAYTVRQI